MKYTRSYISIVFLFLISLFSACSTDEDANAHLGNQDNEMVHTQVTGAQIMPNFEAYIYTYDDDSTFYGYDTDTSKTLDRNEFIDNFYTTWRYHADKQAYKNEIDRYYTAWYEVGEGWNSSNNNDTLTTTQRPDSELSGEELFQKWDVNDNGTIDQDEYRRGMFDLYDKNRNGTLEPQEFRTLQMNI